MNDASTDTPTEQDAERTESAERLARADRGTRGGLAAALGLEAIVTLLVPRALAFSDGGLGATKTVLLVALAVAMIAAAGLVRRPWGIALGSALQVLFLLSGLWLTALLVIAALFAIVWARLLWLRHQLLATPAGWRLLGS